MTDTVNFYRTLVFQVNQFITAYENLVLAADRIAADSALAGNTATAAQANGRNDITTATVNNLNSAMQLLETTLDSTNAGVNTGGTVRLAFYQLM